MMFSKQNNVGSRLCAIAASEVSVLWLVGKAMVEDAVQRTNYYPCDHPGHGSAHFKKGFFQQAVALLRQPAAGLAGKELADIMEANWGRYVQPAESWTGVVRCKKGKLLLGGVTSLRSVRMETKKMALDWLHAVTVGKDWEDFQFIGAVPAYLAPEITTHDVS